MPEESPTAHPISGRCLCGSVSFRITGRLAPVVYCHCSQCRRASGTAFAANAGVRRDEIELISGLDAIREYESSPGKFRAFCSRCGSPIYSRAAADPTQVRIRLGTLDGDPGRRSLAHCWVSAKAVWFDITDQLPQFAEAPPPRQPKPER
jgi:hypothetical protein